MAVQPCMEWIPIKKTVKFLKTNFFFCHLWPKLSKSLPLTSFKCDISSYICLKFPLRCLYIHFLYIPLKGIPHVKHEKSYWLSLFLYFFHNIGPNLTQILQRLHPFWLFCWFPMKYVRGFNSENLLPSLKIAIFWPNFYNNGGPMGHTQNKNNFFAEIIPDHNLSKTFHFIKCMFWLSY